MDEIYKTIFKIFCIMLMFIFFDALWFSYSFTAIYIPLIRDIQGYISTNMMSKIIGGLFAWFLMAVGIVFFVLPLSNSLRESIFYGFLFGLILYGVYNGTNYFLFEKYTKRVFIADLLWGIIVCSIVSGISYKFLKN